MNELIVVEKIAQWQRLKALVLDSVSSPITKRVYSMALDEFLTWFRQESRPGGFCKATISAWRASLEVRRLGSSSIIIRMSAIRKLAAEAADNGLLAPELAAGISRVKSAKTQGIRTGNWLSQWQAQALLSAPDISTLRGLRDGGYSRRSPWLRLAAVRGRSAHFRALATTRWPLVHRRSGRQARSGPHGADADLGEGGRRYVGISSRRCGRTRLPSGKSRWLRQRRSPRREGRLAAH
jgi:hypothetical protein